MGRSLKREPFYSLRLVPDDKLKDKISLINKNLSSKFGGPVFCPHVTLNPLVIGKEQDLKKKCRLLAAELNPFQVNLKSISFTEKFFLSFFLVVEKKSDIMEANAFSKKYFKTKDEPFFPHLSLTYGNYPIEDKEEMMGYASTEELSFLADSIYLCLNNESKLSWEIVARFPFN